MSNRIFPVEITEFSVEQHWIQHNRNSRVIYLMVVMLTVTALISLPFIYVDVTVKSAGITRPITEKTQLRIPLNGKVSDVHIRENTRVNKGDFILSLRTDLLDSRIDFHRSRIAELTTFLEDLSLLENVTEDGAIDRGRIESSLFLKAYDEFAQKLAEVDTRLAQSERSYNRAEVLFEQQIIATKDYEQRLLERDVIKEEKVTLREAQLNRWQVEKMQYQKERQQLVADLNQLEEEKKQYVVVAPKTGTIQNYSNIYAGSNVFANQEIAEISPDSSLIVECYISPKDIGMLHAGMPVIFQVDAFNYNDWGTLTGSIQSISDDIIMVDDNPVFRTRCILNKEVLTLKNGHSGKVKKGMTVTARFKVTERSVFQLLYDKVDNWLNPTLS